MANLENVVQQLKAERDRAQKTVDQLDAALKALGDLGGSPKRNPTRAGRRTMSAAVRRRIAAAQRARWAKWRASNRSQRKA